MPLAAIARRPVPVAALALAAMAWSAPPAAAHEAALPIAGRKVALDADGSGARSFRFRSEKGYDELAASHDPRLGAALLVVGTGGGGNRGPRIELDPARWTPIGPDDAPAGWRYDDPDGTRGGVTRVTLKQGRVAVRARGPSWTYAPTDAQEELWVHLLVEDQWACARFGGDVRKSAPGVFSARDAPSPAACPAPLCGDGVAEADEACDDGDLDPGDGCASDCTVSTCAGESFESTFAALQTVVLDRYGCTAGSCHGGDAHPSGLEIVHATVPGALDANHAALLQATPANAAYAQFVAPGDPSASLLQQALWAKLHCGATPPPPLCDVLDAQNVQPMPAGGALEASELEALALWIEDGAPRDGVVAGTAELLDVCLPDPDPPPPSGGLPAS